MPLQLCYHAWDFEIVLHSQMIPEQMLLDRASRFCDFMTGRTSNTHTHTALNRHLCIKFCPLASSFAASDSELHWGQQSPCHSDAPSVSSINSECCVSEHSSLPGYGCFPYIFHNVFAVPSVKDWFLQEEAKPCRQAVSGRDREYLR